MSMRDFWYVVAASREVMDTPLARQLFGDGVVVFRTGSGDAAVLADVCSHRRAPLSLGAVDGDTIRCPYHGLAFDGTGACVHMPGQSDIPQQHRVRAYPSHERYGMIWAFAGAPEKAETVPLPDLPWREDPEWNGDITQVFEVAAPARLISENLLDLSHVAFVHSSTIGFASGLLAEDPLEMTVEGDRICNKRVFYDVEPPPMHREWGGFSGKVTRTSISIWSPPGNVSILVRNADDQASIETRFDHFVTPQDDESHRYYIAISRNFLIDDANLTRKLDLDGEKVHEEDRWIVEAQYANMLKNPDSPENGFAQDRAVYQAQRILRRLEREHETA